MSKPPPTTPRAWLWPSGAIYAHPIDPISNPLLAGQEVALFDAPTVRQMIESAWRAGYYDAGYTHDSAYADKQAKECANELMSNAGSNGPSGVAAKVRVD